MKKVFGGIFIGLASLILVVTLVVGISYGWGGGIEGILFVLAFSGSLPLFVCFVLFLIGCMLWKSGAKRAPISVNDVKQNND